MRGFRPSSIVFAAALIAGLSASPVATHAQVSPAAASAATPLAFDVVSIKPNKSASGNIRFMYSESDISLRNTRIVDFIYAAYDIKPDLVSGLPGWADSLRLDIEAKMSSEDAEVLKKMDQSHRQSAMKTMEQAVLADRFKFKAHIEVKQLPVYDLVIAKGGARIKEYDPAASHPNALKGSDGKPMTGMSRSSPTGFTGQSVAIDTLINFLENNLHRTVIDKTGLAGKYDLNLTWAPDHDTSPDATADIATSIFTAVEEQLGLKLQPGKGPVDTLVVDHIEQPSEN